MDNNTAAEVATEVTTPEVDNTTATAETSDETTEESADESTTDEPTEGATEEVSEETTEEQPIYIPVKFNKQHRELTVEEATSYAQKGMKYEQIQPVLNKLSLLAAENNLGYEDYIEQLYQAAEADLDTKLRETAGGNDEMYELLKEAANNKRQKALENLKGTSEANAQQSQEDEVRRVAREFLDLQKRMPNKYNTYADLPDEVKATAEKNNIPLYYAALEFESRQKQVAEKTKKSAEKAKTASAGSQKSQTDTSTQSAIDIMRGVFKTI